MKTRSDFVANSSSSSFVFYLPSYDAKFVEMQKLLSDRLEKVELPEGSWNSDYEHPFTKEEAPDEEGEWHKYEMESDEYDSEDDFDRAYAIACQVFKKSTYEFETY